MYFPRNWEFGSALSKLRNFGGGDFEQPKPPLGTPLITSKHSPRTLFPVTLELYSTLHLESNLHIPAVLPPEKNTVLTEQGALWAPQSVWKIWK